MGRVYESIDTKLEQWIAEQPLFFIGSAPNDPDGHVNISPKGGKGMFRVLGPNRVAYLDLVGSGVETAAHLMENGRIVVMFCAFSGPPKIVRLHGQGHVIDRNNDRFTEALAWFDVSPEALLTLRSIIEIEVTRVGDSCGFVVPRMELVAERDQLFKWADNKQRTTGDTWKDEYIADRNHSSIDGLPGLSPVDADLALSGDALRKRSSDGKAL